MGTNIGDKIKQFRKRAGLSQFDLEIQIGASPGSLSRIENGQINPTKETLLKISSVLELNELEQSNIFAINRDISISVLKNICDLVKKSNTEDLLNSATSMFLKELKLLGVIICLIEGNLIKARALTSLWYTPIINKIIGRDFKSLQYRLNDELFKSNLMYKVIKEKRSIISEKLEDFACPPLSKAVAKALVSFTGNKSNICFPIICSEQVVGTILFTKAIHDNFQIEKGILEEFVNVLGYKVMELEKRRNG